MYIDVYMELEKITLEAFRCTDGDNAVWIPRSLIDEDATEVEEVGDSGVVWMEHWFAQQEGLI